MENYEITEIIDSKYIIEEKIGSGGQANIFKVVKVGTNKRYAAKVFKKDTDSVNEINMLKKVSEFKCPYIINSIKSGYGEVIRINRETEKRKYIILEKEDNGCIADYIIKKQSGIGELYSKILFQKILIGFQCLHRHNICHRDIKLENILFDDNFSPKICDFGMACFNSSELIFSGGTDKYKPPEVDGKTKYDGIKSDIFCLASALMYLTTGSFGFKLPTKDDEFFKCIYLENYDLYWKLEEPQINYFDLSSNFKELFWKMISYNPSKRPTIDEILEHPWFEEINNIKKNNFNKFKKLEEEIKELFKELAPYVKISLNISLQKDNWESTFRSYNRSISNNDDQNYFDSFAKPKCIDTPMNIKYCIDIQGYLNPILFMNKLCVILDNEYKHENCYINTDSEILKFNFIFVKKIEEKENKKEDGNKDTDSDEEKNNNEIIIQIKLYESSEKYILRFKEKKGNRKDFLDKYYAISNLIVKLLNNLNYDILNK